ncbi:hypothetical protein PN499_26455 [Kamptonema animale CS-326]|uniref:hypothetical protein n=1 Tax=Kamptonema animale TaxID=92934 RepID=UPI00232F0588|nr:hypothetical protein [Kamptonema animale]MDB9514750.1 hypothetical protein [Kamptonema animale CS-326]
MPFEAVGLGRVYGISRGEPSLQVNRQILLSPNGTIVPGGIPGITVVHGPSFCGSGGIRGSLGLGCGLGDMGEGSGGVGGNGILLSSTGSVLGFGGISGIKGGTSGSIGVFFGGKFGFLTFSGLS